MRPDSEDTPLLAATLVQSQVTEASCQCDRPVPLRNGNTALGILLNALVLFSFARNQLDSLGTSSLLLNAPDTNDYIRRTLLL